MRARSRNCKPQTRRTSHSVPEHLWDLLENCTGQCRPPDCKLRGRRGFFAACQDRGVDVRVVERASLGSLRWSRTSTRKQESRGVQVIYNIKAAITEVISKHRAQTPRSSTSDSNTPNPSEPVVASTMRTRQKGKLDNSSVKHSGSSPRWSVGRGHVMMLQETVPFR